MGHRNTLHFYVVVAAVEMDVVVMVDFVIGEVGMVEVAVIAAAAVVAVVVAVVVVVLRACSSSCPTKSRMIYSLPLTPTKSEGDQPTAPLLLF